MSYMLYRCTAADDEGIPNGCIVEDWHYSAGCRSICIVGKVTIVNLFSTEQFDENRHMNTSSLSARTSRLSSRTTVEGVFHRIGRAFGKLRDLSGEVSMPVMTRSTEMAHLPRGMVLTLGPDDGVSRLEIARGTVWTTSTPARGDVVLKPGDVYEFGDQWPYVVEALSDSEVISAGRGGRRPLAASGGAQVA